MTAKYIGRCKHEYDDGVDLFYEYKGYEYTITIMNNGCMDDYDIKQQHIYHQNRINEIIEDREKANLLNEFRKPVDIDEIFELLGWE